MWEVVIFYQQYDKYIYPNMYILLKIKGNLLFYSLFSIYCNLILRYHFDKDRKQQVFDTSKIAWNLISKLRMSLNAFKGTASPDRAIVRR